jgi:hypothetical protein
MTTARLRLNIQPTELSSRDCVILLNKKTLCDNLFFGYKNTM